MTEILHPFLTNFRQILRGNIDQYFVDKECYRSSFYSDNPLTIRHFETGLWKSPGKFGSARHSRGMKLGAHMDDLDESSTPSGRGDFI